MKEKLSRVSKLEGHLNKGIKPIFACVVGRSDKFGDKDFTKKMADYVRATAKKFVEIPGKVHDVEYLGREQFLQTDSARCVISQIDDLDKFSGGFFECTGLVVCGIDKKTGKNVSFLSHQN